MGVRPGHADRNVGATVSPQASPWSPWRMLQFLVRRVIVDPVREGRLRDTGWSAGLRAVVAAGIVCFAVAVGMTVFAQQIRTHTQLVLQVDSTVPVMALPILVVIFLFAMTCLFTAGLHMTLWVRIPVTLTTLAVLIQPLELADGWQSSDFVVAAGMGMTVLLVAVRWRGAFVWWEFVAALTIIGTTVVVPMMLISQASTPTVRPMLMYGAVLQVSTLLWTLAVPVSFLAGAAMAELTASTVTWSVTTVWQGLNVWRRRILPFGLGLMLVLVLGWAARLVWGIYQQDLDYHWPMVLAGAAYGALPLVCCALVSRRADRAAQESATSRPDPDDVPGAWGGFAPVLALIFAVGILGDSFLFTIAREFGLGEWIQPLVAWSEHPWNSPVRSILTSLAVFSGAWWLAGKGNRIVPMGLAAFAGLLLTDMTLSRLGIAWSYVGLLTGIVLAVVVIFGWLWARRELTAERGLALLTVLLLAWVFEYRDVIFEPLTAIIGLAGVGSALLVGLVWRLLTDNGYTHGDSARFPQAGRVLVALANVTFGVAVLALDALMGGAWVGDLVPFEGAGDRYLGVSMFLTVMYAGLALALRGRALRPTDVTPEPVDEGNQFPSVRGDELWHTGWRD